MSESNLGSYQTHPYNAQAACEHGEGIIRHEVWCQTLNPAVCYASTIVVSPTKLTIGDALILHSLGVLWDRCPTYVQRPAGCGPSMPRSRSISSRQSVRANIKSTPGCNE